VETKRGYKEAPWQFEVLRAKWPKAFPAKPRDVRPLASGAVAINPSAIEALLSGGAL
jgi:hypothetical protein